MAPPGPCADVGGRPLLKVYLDELERELSCSMSSSEVQACLTEARAHLEDSVQARLEMGESREEAEVAAVAAFGRIVDMREEVRRRRGAIDRPFVTVTIGFVLFYLYLRSSASTFLSLPTLAIVLFLHGMFAVTSVRAHRPQWKAFVALACVLWVGMAASRTGSEVFVGHSYPGQTVQRSRVADEVRQTEKSLDEVWDRASLLGGEHANFLAGVSGLSPREGRTVPMGIRDLAPSPSRTEGERRWNVALRYLKMVTLSDAARFGTRWTALQEAAQRPWSKDFVLQLLPEEEKVALMQGLGGYAAAHVLLWTLGAAIRRRKTRRATLA